jgi:hypothetical protein
MELKLFGSITGMPINFSINFTHSLNVMHLTYESILHIECQRVIINFFFPVFRDFNDYF